MDVEAENNKQNLFEQKTFWFVEQFTVYISGLMWFDFSGKRGDETPLQRKSIHFVSSVFWLTYQVRKCSQWVPVWPSYGQEETSDAVARPCGPLGRTEGPCTPAWSSAEEDKASRGQSVADDNHRLRPQWHGQDAYAARPGLGKRMVGTSLQSRKGTWNWEGKWDLD